MGLRWQFIPQCSTKRPLHMTISCCRTGLWIAHTVWIFETHLSFFTSQFERCTTQVNSCTKRLYMKGLFCRHFQLILRLASICKSICCAKIYICWHLFKFRNWLASLLKISDMPINSKPLLIHYALTLVLWRVPGPKFIVLLHKAPPISETFKH